MRQKQRHFASLTVRRLWTALLALLLLGCWPVAAQAEVKELPKDQLARVLAGWVPQISGSPVLNLRHPELGPLVLEPALDPYLQAAAESRLKPLKSRRAAIVILEPHTGRVLALAGINKRKADPRVALDATAPAASLFKVVTAAAALQEADLCPASSLGYVGRPHTLYRFQLREKPRYRPREVTLAKSFARSNNPVFARLGIFNLGSEVLTEYAQQLGFERQLTCEVPLQASHLVKPSSSYSIGEMASGFNRITTMSPLHAALMVSVFLNGGRLPQPWLVRRLSAINGETYYQGEPRLGPRVMDSQTCAQMQDLFQATVAHGTAKKAFRRLYRDRVLKHLELGGKTGTIRGPDRQELFEWFAGYGRDPMSGRTLAISVLVVHGKVRYANPKRLARVMLREAFRSSMTAQKAGGRVF